MRGREIVARRPGVLDLREVAARATLRDIRLQGHAYVELRQDGKRTIFFCTLCLTPCYSDSVLFDHLRGSLHSRRYAAAKVTLFGPVPWPFSDGVLFFNNICEREQNMLITDSQNETTLAIKNGNPGDEVTATLRDIGMRDTVDDSFSLDRNCNNHANVNDVNLAKSSKSNGNLDVSTNGHDKLLKCKENDSGLVVIPGVLVQEEVSNLRVKFIGCGHVGSRIQETNEGCSNISRIWCAWLGLENAGDSELLASPRSDFAVVNFSYTYDLGRKGSLDDLNSPLSPGSFFEIDDFGRPRNKRKKSFSDPEDSSEGLTDRFLSSGEHGSNLCGGALVASHQLETSRLIASKAVRRELRKQKSLAAERTCGICGQVMLIRKDVATLLNCKTGKLACSSRNKNGAFHLFHTSCLIHWILLCEFETWTNQSTNKKSTTRGRKGKFTQKNRISLVFCPECQGTGKHIEGDELEQPTVPLSEMFLYKLKAIEAQKAWMKNPEVLQKCSTGLQFATVSAEKSQEKVIPVKLLHFYRADE